MYHFEQLMVKELFYGLLNMTFRNHKVYNACMKKIQNEVGIEELLKIQRVIVDISNRRKIIKASKTR